MEELKCCAGGCGHKADKSLMHYRPETIRRFTREWYYCDVCEEKRRKLLNLKLAKSALRNTSNINRSRIRSSNQY